MALNSARPDSLQSNLRLNSLLDMFWSIKQSIPAIA